MTNRVVINAIAISARHSVSLREAAIYEIASKALRGKTDNEPSDIDAVARDIALRGYYDHEGEAFGLHFNTCRNELELVRIGTL